jgi:uncharacterized protein with NRDE domain
MRALEKVISVRSSSYHTRAEGIWLVFHEGRQARVEYVAYPLGTSVITGFSH